MSVSIDSGGGGRGNESQDFDLNLAPIIDSFTVLIAFMLVSASFLSIGILDAGISAAGSVPTNAAPPPVTITVELTPAQQINVKLAGKSTDKFELRGQKGAYDLEGLNARMAELRKQWQGVDAVTLVSEESVQYKDVIQVMENLRKNMPVVLLGGF